MAFLTITHLLKICFFIKILCYLLKSLREKECVFFHLLIYFQNGCQRRSGAWNCVCVSPLADDQPPGSSSAASPGESAVVFICIFLVAREPEHPMCLDVFDFSFIYLKYFLFSC